MQRTKGVPPFKKGFYMKSITILFLLLLNISIVNGKEYISLKESLKRVLSEGETVLKKDIHLSKQDVEFLNKMYNSDHFDGEKITIFYGKNAKGEITWYLVSMVEIIREFNSYHNWALAFNADMTIKKVFLIKLLDEYSFVLDNENFLNQFVSKESMTLSLLKNIDGISSATMSCNLLIGSLKKAEFLILKSFKE
jgi:hypothetical protein